MENKLDSNAAVGILQAIFPFEMTLVQATCTGCCTTNAIGETAAYMHGMGTIVGCPSCDNVLIRIVHAGDAICWICEACASLKLKRGKPGPFAQGLVPAQSLAQKGD